MVRRGLARLQTLESSSDRGRVLVFQPRWLAPEEAPTRFPHRLVPILGALRAAGFGVRFAEESYDGVPGPAWDDEIRKADALVAWCGEMYPGTQVPGLLAFLARANAAANAAPDESHRRPLFVGGGFFPLVDVEPLGLAGRVDGIVTGPGELVLPRVIEAALAGQPLTGQAGLAVHAADGFHPAGPAPRKALDGRWNAPLAELDLRRYPIGEPEIFDNWLPALQILTGSGCAKHCPFCFDEHTPFGVFSAADVADALDVVHGRTGVRQFLLGELDFFHRHGRALEFVEAQRARGSPYRWFALSSVCDLGRWTDGELDQLARSGCYRLELGTESGSDEHLARLGKRHRAAEAIELAHRLHRRGIRTTHNLLLGAPGETPSDRRASLRLVGALDRPWGFARVQARVYQIVPNTTMGRAALASLPRVPRTLEEIAGYRGTLTRPEQALPWLDASDAQWVIDLADHVVPLAIEHHPAPDVAHRVARVLARLRCRTGVRLGTAAERRWFARAARTPTSGTLVE